MAENSITVGIEDRKIQNNDHGMFNKKIGSTSCTNTDLLQLRTLNVEIAKSILSELCYLPTAVTFDFFVCSFHLKTAQRNLKDRKKKKYCEVPAIYTNHGSCVKRPIGERHITTAVYQSIAKTAGVFLPVGTGKMIPWDENERPMSKELKVHLDWTDVDFVGFQNDEHNQQQHQNFLDCPNSDCSKQFRSSKTLEEHVLLGDCHLEMEHRSLVDRTKINYAKKLENHEQTCCTIPSNTTSQSCQSNIQMGWALKAKKKAARFTEEQKHFMREKFKIGKRTGSKVDPISAAEEMMQSGQFDKKHFLSAQQIASYFSRLSQKERTLDTNSAKVELAHAQLKQEIVADCDLEILEA